MEMDTGATVMALEGMREQVDRLTLLSICACAVLLILLAAVLIVLLRMRRRNRKVEAWLDRHFQAIESQQDEILRQIETPPYEGRIAAAKQFRRQQAQQAASHQAGTEAPRPAPASAPDTAPQGNPGPPVRPPQRAPVAPSPAPGDLTATLNEMLSGNQPYNFIEAVRAIEPGLTLRRLIPRGTDDVFDKKVVLEAGGDGLFAAINGTQARLYPNYSRFSATLDPKPLFDGARHGARIHAVLEPALLKAQGEDWMLVKRGRVQMRQGS